MKKSNNNLEEASNWLSLAILRLHVALDFLNDYSEYQDEVNTIINKIINLKLMFNSDGSDAEDTEEIPF